MKRNYLLSATIACAICLSIFIGMLMWAWLIPNDSKPYNISICYGIKASVSKEFGGLVYIFNQDQPYTTGSLVMGKVEEWGGLGIGFIQIKDATPGDTWWTLSISIWYPILIFGVLLRILWRKAVKINTTLIV